MPPTKECPMCGESMRLVERTITHRLPGVSQVLTRTAWEWGCPECDYYEEADLNDDEAGKT